MRSRALSGIFTSGRRPQGFSSTLLKVPIHEGCPIHPHRNGPYKLCVDPYGSNGLTTGVYGL